MEVHMSTHVTLYLLFRQPSKKQGHPQKGGVANQKGSKAYSDVLIFPNGEFAPTLYFRPTAIAEEVQRYVIGLLLCCRND